MKLHHLSTGAQDARERGLSYGRALGSAIAGSVAAYAEFWNAWGFAPEDVRRFGGAAGERIAAWAPHTAAELAAVAEATGVAAEQIYALTARTELLAHTEALASECSTVAVVDARGARSAQTWDWYPLLSPEAAVLHHPAETGLPAAPVTVFTEAGMLAKLGANSAGLGLHFNILSHRLDGAGALTDVGVPVHVVAREILLRADTVGAAREIAASAELTASTVLTVSTATEAACLELSPVGVAVVAPEDGFLWHTNHFRHEDLRPDDTVDPQGTTWARGAFLEAQREALVACTDAAQLLGRMCQPPVLVAPDPQLPPYERSATLLKAGIDYPLLGPPVPSFTAA